MVYIKIYVSNYFQMYFVESLAANFTSRVEKRGRKKKSVDHEEIVVKTERIESKPRGSYT